MSERERGASSVVRCPSCRAAVDAALETCPFCGTRLASEPVEPEAPAPDESAAAVVPAVEPEREGAPKGHGLATRIVVLAVGLGLLAGIALVQRSAQRPPQRGRPAATTPRDTPTPTTEVAAAPYVTAPPPSPQAEAPAGRVCPSRSERDVERHYGHERDRVGLWFRRLERYNDHDLRLGGDRSAHARRGAAIDDARRSRLGALDGRHADALLSCDARLLV